MTTEFRRDFLVRLPAYSRVQFEDLVAQRPLFEDQAPRDKWIARLEQHKRTKDRGRAPRVSA